MSRDRSKRLLSVNKRRENNKATPPLATASRMSSRLSSNSIFIFEVTTFLEEALVFFDSDCKTKLVCEPQPGLSNIEVCLPCLWRCGDLGKPYVFERISAALFGIRH
jgi:hypothetical protein